MPVNHKTTYCDVFAFLWRSLQVMGYFFDCFRVRNVSPPNTTRPPAPVTSSPPPPPLPKEEVAEKIRLSSLFSADERAECVTKDQESLLRRLGPSGLDKDLLEEAKLLKACGTLPQTPAEIRKAVTFSDKIERSDIESPPSALIYSPDTPVVVQQSEVLPRTVERSLTGTLHNASESSPETPKEIHNSETLAGITEKSNVREPHTLVKASPYPTPRKITDDMQTPGTVFATNMRSLTKGNAQIRSQYVYGVLNPISSDQLEELKEEHVTLQGSSDQEGESLLQQEDSISSPVVQSGGNAAIEEAVGDASLSSWLKPPSASCRKPNFGRTPGDRPIIGLVASHWNEQEDTSHVSPKWWDGNGIPNSTTKYKEDQKVRWHATPFEERLEKALSEETGVPQRKLIGGTPIIFEELEGQDTASSELQSVNCQKSVVSF